MRRRTHRKRQPDAVKGGGGAWEPRRFGYFDASAYVASDTTLGSQIETVINTSGGDFSVLLLWQADLNAAPDTTTRAVWAAMRSDDYGVVFAGRDYTDGSKYRTTGGSTATPPVYTVYNHTGTGPELVDGSIHQLAHVDVGTTTTGDVHAQVDDGSDLTLASGYTRANLGTVHRLNFGGENRTTGILPTLGWCYAAAVVDEDIRTSLDTIYTAFSDAYASDARNMHRACLAWLAAIETAATAPANVLYGEIYRANGSAAYGGDGTRTAVQYVIPEVAP